MAENNRAVIVIGAGGHGRVILDILRQNRSNVLGFLDASKSVGYEIDDAKVIGKDSDINRFVDEASFVVGIGDNWTRSQIVKKLKETNPNIQFVSALHPRAIISPSVTIGVGTVVMAGAVINPGTHIGSHCIVNTSASIDHDCEIADFAAIQPGAVLGGNIKVGENSVISLGAKVIHGRSIGAHSVIGAGSTVLDDIPPFAVAYGTPATVVRNRQTGDRYL